MGVPFAVAGAGFHPDATFNLTGDELLLPANIKAPLPLGVEGVLQLRLWQFGQADLVEEDVVPVDVAAAVALLWGDPRFIGGGIILNC